MESFVIFMHGWLKVFCPAATVFLLLLIFFELSKNSFQFICFSDAY